jgi:hypothetical protein
LPFGLFYIT